MGNLISTSLRSPTTKTKVNVVMGKSKRKKVPLPYFSKNLTRHIKLFMAFRRKAKSSPHGKVSGTLNLKPT